MRAVRSKWRAILLDALAVVGLALLPQLYFWRLFPVHPTDQKTLVDGDLNQEHFPIMVTVARALSEGQLPLWNPYSNGGQPLLADPQAALFYPPTWWALSGVHGFDGDSFLALERLIPFHFSLLGTFMYALGRVLLRSRIAAVVAAIAFTYSGFVTAYPVQQLPILRAIAWLPLQVLGLWLGLERRSLGWALFAGVALGIAGLAGHPQTVFQESLVLACVAAVWAYQNRAGGRSMAEVTWPLQALVVVGMVAVGLAAVQWVPSLEFLQRSNRAELDYAFVSGGYAFWELPMDLLAPRVLGGLPVYVGIVPLILAAAAVMLRSSRVHGLALVLGTLGLILSLGGNSFAYSGAYRFVPGFAVFRDQERAIFMFAFGVAMLAGSGAALLAGELSRVDLRRINRLLKALKWVLFAALAVGAGLYVAQISAEVSEQGFLRWRSIVGSFFFFVLLLGFGIGLLLMRTRVISARAIFVPLTVGLVILDLFTVSWDQPLQDTFPNDLFKASQIVNRAVADVGAGRAVDEGVLNGYHGLIYGLPSINKILAIHLERFELATERVPQARLWDLLNVGLVVTRDRKPDLQLVTEEKWDQFTNLLYRRPGGPGPAWVVPEARAVGSGSEALTALKEPGFDPRAAVIVEGVDAASLGRGGTGTVSSYRRGWNDLEAKVTAPQGGYLVMSEIAYPGWESEVDGVGTPILQADYLLRAVWLTPGDHVVRLQYRPNSVVMGAAITAFTALCLVGWFARRAIWRTIRPGAVGRPNS